VAGFGTAAGARPEAARPRCLSECTPRIGIVSAFGAEADLLLARLRQARVLTIQGNRVSIGVLEGQPVAVVLSGVSMVNAAMVTQQLLDHFRVTHLVMSGIAGGVDPALHVGDVTVPDRWAMPLEVYWAAGPQAPSPCGPAGELGCLGLQLAAPEGRPLAPFAPSLPQGSTATGSTLFIRANQLMNRANAPKGEFRFDYPVDPAMLEVARQLRPQLPRGGPRAGRPEPAARPQVDESRCVKQPPRLVVGGRGLSAPVFLADAAYRRYLFEQLQGRSFDMETAALAHVAHANQVPYIAFRSLSDLAGGDPFDAEAAALFSSGLAERNASEVTLGFLRAWGLSQPPGQKAGRGSSR
jgi:adenosylhomocysteine nucleosidase